MSKVFDAIAWAIKVSKGEPMPARMLLIVGLATRVGHGNDFVVWPSVRQLAEDTDMSRASVQRWMNYLVERNLVERYYASRENGATASNRYRLPIRAVFYHPTKGPIEDQPSDEPEAVMHPTKVVNGIRVLAGPPIPVGGVWRSGPHGEAGVGPHSEAGGASTYEAGGASPGEACKEHPFEQPYEDSTVAHTQENELDLGLPPLPTAETKAADVAKLIEKSWPEHATPLRGGKLSPDNAEKAFALAEKFGASGADILVLWRELFERVDASDFLQGKVAPREDRTPFKLSISFVLERRNFTKILEGRYNGKSSGNQRRGSTAVATGRVIDRIRASGSQRAGRGDPAVGHGRIAG